MSISESLFLPIKASGSRASYCHRRASYSKVNGEVLNPQHQWPGDALPFASLNTAVWVQPSALTTKSGFPEQLQVRQCVDNLPSRPSSKPSNHRSWAQGHNGAHGSMVLAASSPLLLYPLPLTEACIFDLGCLVTVSKWMREKQNEWQVWR